MSIYAVSDLHGELKLYQNILRVLKPEDKIICLGDCNDRGDQGWEIIKEMLTNPQFIYLKGNHEDMLVKAVLGSFYSNTFPKWDIELLVNNGGRQTYLNCLDDPANKEYLLAISQLPLTYFYHNVNGFDLILSHAGYTPRKNRKPQKEDLLWDRFHFTQKWSPAKQYEKTIIVHGHTPIPYLKKALKDGSPTGNEPHAYWYCGNHKVCLDNGSYATKKAIMLNLDTFEEIIINED